MRRAVARGATASAAWGAIAVAAVLVSPAAAAPADYLELPAGTLLRARLERTASSHASKVGDPVVARLVVPVMIGPRQALAAGAILQGSVVENGTLKGRERRARLLLAFTRVSDPSGNTAPMEARLAEVEGARETVDAEGRIVGVAPVKARPSGTEALLKLAADLDPLALGLVDVGERTVRAVVWLEPGTELLLRLARPARVRPPAPPAPPEDLSDRAELRRLVASQPVRGQVEGVPAEPANVLLGGSKEAMEAALAAAGWKSVESRARKAATRAFLALAQQHGYAPPPPLLLDGRPPDIELEKMTNTLARRHRLRLWQRPDVLRGQPIWLGVVSRETALEFPRGGGVFVHRLAPRLDEARERLVAELIAGGRVTASALAERGQAPSQLTTPAGDRLETDGRLAVLLLK